MLVLAIRNYGPFQKGGAYEVDDRDGRRWIAQDMMAPLDGMALTGCWDGYSVAVLASGPSLTKADVAKVKKWRDGAENRRVVVVNATYQIAPWADVLIGLDKDFWDNYRPDFAGEKLTQHGQVAAEHGCKLFFAGGQTLRTRGNSGLAAIDMAAKMGAARIILLGMDGQLGAGGKVHWHGDHKAGMMNGTNHENWPAQARTLAAALRGVEVLNATRKTAIDAWPLVKLEEVLKC